MLQRWIAAFNEAARSLLAQRQARVPLLEAEPCPDHGAGCVRILAGDFIIDHAVCATADPGDRAATLLRRHSRHEPGPGSTP
jgi:hypothetical protein